MAEQPEKEAEVERLVAAYGADGADGAKPEIGVEDEGMYNNEAAAALQEEEAAATEQPPAAQVEPEPAAEAPAVAPEPEVAAVPEPAAAPEPAAVPEPEMAAPASPEPAPEEVAPPAPEPEPVSETPPARPDPPSEPVPEAPPQAASQPPGGDSAMWKVDTSYIDWRTQDPNRLEPRRSVGADMTGDAAKVGSAMPSATASKTEDGKWTVDTSYVNHRTLDVDRLDGRKSTMDGKEKVPEKSIAGGFETSSTVKKESDGKWKVDTSYIGYRTGDPNNLDRKMEKSDEPEFADPETEKHSYEELKSAQRPKSVDPAKKELYLSEADFQTVFGMSMADFQKLPKWKQTNMKKAKELF